MPLRKQAFSIFLPQLSDFVPLRNGFIVPRSDYRLVDPDSYTVVARGVADLYPY